MRNKKELLNVLKNFVLNTPEDKFKHLAISIDNLSLESKIKHSEQDLLYSTLIYNSPKIVSSFDWWCEHDKQSSIIWLNKQIDES